MLFQLILKYLKLFDDYNLSRVKIKNTYTQKTFKLNLNDLIDLHDF